MNPSNNFQYTAKPIWRLDSLALALNVDRKRLELITSKANQLYYLAKEVLKNDGSIRRTYDARANLKQLHRKIKSEILDKVIYPQYVTGGIQGTDYLKNASMHTGAKIVITEDIKRFFGSTTTDAVYDIWNGFFGFGPEVSEYLTKLTTLNNELPEGAITSSQLANLVFWKSESQLVEKLDSKGFCYSRYIDDISVSSKTFISSDMKTEVVTAIYGMLRKHGYDPKRTKHAILSSSQRMIVTQLSVNKKLGLAHEDLSNTRARVHRFERAIAQGEVLDFDKEYRSLTGKINQMSRLHPGKAKGLKKRVFAIKEMFISSRKI
ncbi:reverse transcriptase family protein [uncultured Oxalobacter sp.]|mgnify:CR=1 FL=1|uniref:reverse transcriptase family protein n=1 Tax=uncultured Oxalobacter sp. TaxID=337245 RepID=UPI002596651D|nr:reverse transcriptase family protein [uncultured Oxalobacter sp.]